MRNVVLVTIDSLRADHCGFMGYEQDTTPTLDAMADGGLAFMNAIAPGPSTYESLPGVFTGRHMVEFSGEDRDELDARNRQIRLNTRAPTIPEWFEDQGYTTAAFTTNPYTGRHTNFARGFGRYEDFLDGGEARLMQAAAHLPVVSELKHLITLARGDRASKPWRSYYDEIREWLTTVTEPYFLWVFLLDPHTPYLVSGENRERSRLSMYYHNWKLWVRKKWGLQPSVNRSALVDLYDGAIRSADGFLHRLRDDLPGDAAIVVHADHGEAFGEHGAYGHHRQLYEENLHVPLVVDDDSRDENIEDPISLIELPRVLRAVAGRSLSELRFDSQVALSKTLGPEQMSLRGRAWKYVAQVNPEERVIEDEVLYDLERDPEESEDVSNEHAERQRICRHLIQGRLFHEREADTIHRTVANQLAGGVL